MTRSFVENSWKQRVGVSFSHASASYNRTALVQRQTAELLMTHVRQHVTTSLSSVVDFGAGTGFLTEKIIAQFPTSTLTAVDIAPGMVDHLQYLFRDNQKVRVLCADMEKVSIPPCDLIASSFSLHWVTNLQKTLSSWHSLLVSRGFLAISLPVEGSLQSLFSLKALSSPHSFFPHYKELLQELLPSFTILHAECIEVREVFSSPLSALKNLKEIGGAVSPQSPSYSQIKTLLSLRRWDQDSFALPWKVACIIAQKKEPS